MSRSLDPRYHDLAERFPILRMIGNTPLIRIDLPELEGTGSTIHAKAEWLNPGGSIKDRPVMRMLAEAMLAGDLDGQRHILDSSSGNAGIAYAMIGAAMGQPVTLVVPGNASKERKDRIRAHGALLIETDPLEGYDAALREAHRMQESEPEAYFMPDQYANANNWMAHHETTGREILEQTEGDLTHFVAGIGTGGTITGVGRLLREERPGVRVVCTVPEVFPGIEGLKPLTTPEDIVPKILDESVIDERIEVSIEDAFDCCQILARQGIFVGQSSGAFLEVARRVARAHPGSRIVTVFSDLGERYFSTNMWTL